MDVIRFYDRCAVCVYIRGGSVITTLQSERSNGYMFWDVERLGPAVWAGAVTVTMK